MSWRRWRRRIEKDAAEQAAANMEETKRQAAKELEKAESRRTGGGTGGKSPEAALGSGSGHGGI